MSAVLTQIFTWLRNRQKDAAEIVAMLVLSGGRIVQRSDDGTAEVRRLMVTEEAPLLGLYQLGRHLRRSRS